MAANEFAESDLFTSLSEARVWLEAHKQTPAGAICPCCDQFAKVYDRAINRASIRNLASLYRHTKRHGEGFYHYTDFMPTKYAGFDFAKLVFIGLLIRATNDDPVKKTSGMYQITERGIAFVEDRVAIPSRLVFYNNELIDTGGLQQYIGDFWPDFDYEDLMK